MNILIVKLSAIGDVVHTLPSLAALRKLYPEAYITWVVEEKAADLILDHPLLNRVVVSRRISWIENLKRGKVREVFREVSTFVKILRDRRYDLIIDFHGLLKSSLIVMLSKGMRTLGYKSLQELSGLFYREKIPEDLTKHAVDRYLDFVAYLGGDVTEKKFLIPEKEVDIQHVEDLLRSSEALKNCNGFVAVNPFALWETKLWSEKKFAELCDRIYQELNRGIVLTGGYNDGPYLASIEKNMTSPVLNLGGKTTLRQLASLYRRADLVVSTDTGPMHIAAAVGTPVVALFGPTDPRRTGPYGTHHRVVRLNIPCSPCFLKKCYNKACMSNLDVEPVFNAVSETLGGKHDDKQRAT
ncbi:MAG: lipopolysaccharide heptosyltransferase II [Syntrophales bacterium]|nr:lipopolysaccharide heptosyltransferase II [Syntrophales bacterium]